MGWSHAIQKKGHIQCSTTFYKNTKMMGPLKPTPRAGLPGGESSGMGGCPPERGCSSRRAWEEQCQGCSVEKGTSSKKEVPNKLNYFS